MQSSWKDNIYQQREQLARMLHEPLTCLAEQCAPMWGQREALNAVLQAGFDSIPFCTYLYCIDTDAVQICDNVEEAGVVSGHFGRDRSQRPYMKEAVPVWGFLLSDAYISLAKSRPSLTALQIVRAENGQPLGYLEPGHWRQIKGDPAIRGTVFQQCRIESPMDQNLDQALSILEELLTQRGVFQCQIHFSSSQATIWTLNDPFRYRILDQEALSDADICLVYPPQPYPADAVIPVQAVARILATLRSLRMADENIYLRMSSINLFNGLVSLTFSCDGTHYMRYDEFLVKDGPFWF
jgi:hypothetical protein